LDAKPWKAFMECAKLMSRDKYIMHKGVKKINKDKRRETFNIGWLKLSQATCNINFTFFKNDGAMIG
jgi:hypothetical protein